MPRNTGSQPGAMVTESHRVGSGVAVMVAIIVAMIAAYAFWPIV